MLTTFISGLSHFLAGAMLIFKPTIRRYVIIPLTINILTFAALFIMASHYIAQCNTWLLQHMPAWLHWLEYAIWLIFFLSFFLTAAYLFTMLANLLSAPFNGALSAAVEHYLTSKPLPSRPFTAQLKDTPNIIARSLRLTLYYLPRALGLSILFIIPVLQVMAPIVWFLFHAYFMALIYLDYPTDNHHISLSALHVYLKKNRAQALGFGTAVLIATLIPVLNFFVIPMAVAGATHLYHGNTRAQHH